MSKLNAVFCRPSNEIPRPPLPTIVGLGQNGCNTNNYTHPNYGTYKLIKTENSAGNRNFGVNMPSLAHQTFQKTAAYNLNTTSVARRNNAVPRPPLPPIVRLGQNGYNRNNRTHPYHRTDKMIKAENTAENQICGVNIPSVAHQAFQKTAVYNTNTISAGRPSNAIPRPPLPTIVGFGRKVNMPSVAHQAFQKTGVYNTNTISAGRPSNAIPRPPLPTIVGFGQNEHSGNNKKRPYHETDKMIKAENKAENQICGVNMPSVAHQAFQKTAVYNPNTISAGRPSTAILRPPLHSIVRLGRDNEGTSTNASLSLKQPIRDAATMIGKPQDNQS
ncbi:hypothetical protein T07_14602 [Trichinella nelsoni]|uniref:Uncharacterized protein n=1 Tax=Trichinella nelsoni TaxID=6336 RepID=A0A0V0RQV2_9BILA|nr:hypothetical protein T07_14602 [Trichinella nelsoni]